MTKNIVNLTRNPIKIITGETTSLVIEPQTPPVERNGNMFSVEVPKDYPKGESGFPLIDLEMKSIEILDKGVTHKVYCILLAHPRKSILESNSAEKDSGNTWTPPNYNTFYIVDDAAVVNYLREKEPDAMSLGCRKF